MRGGNGARRAIVLERRADTTVLQTVGVSAGPPPAPEETTGGGADRGPAEENTARGPDQHRNRAHPDMLAGKADRPLELGTKREIAGEVNQPLHPPEGENLGPDQDLDDE